MSDGWYVIKDLDGFINHTRRLVYNSYGSKKDTNDEEMNDIDLLMELSTADQEELDRVLSYKESSIIIRSLLKKQKNKKTKLTRFILNDDLYVSIVENLGDRMTSNILHGLVKKGLIETAFDEESNDFIFWIKDDNEEKH